MGESIISRRGLAHAAASILLAGLVAACAEGIPSEPAPVYLKGGMTGGPEAASIPAQRHDVRLTVRPGQSVRGFAHAYHVPERTIIAANHLAPPYKIKIGQDLLIPGAVEGPVQQASLPPKTVYEVPPPVAPPPTPPPIAAAPVPLAPTPVAAAPAAAPTPQPIHDIISLDDPPPAVPSKAIAFPDPPPRVTPPSFSPPPQGSSREPSAADEARAEDTAPSAALHGGRYPWPVRGRVLAAYGVAAGGTHNDGINIAAPKGAPIAAIDGGVVAYAGNELRGYGNLVLVKHPSGFISAYAHCEELLVKQGEKVNRGQVIAKVGTTGGVSEPQLHFELRRGKRAVDPREFLSPAPSAGTQPAAG
ncbi:MAG TPA: peptidoglycan DD-metalloendopeptidase family protein [Stellaceae bacterium]|jgi:murein DD-endopeptidase MepM/ murein hydrolase activator NlpD|nr:peptidoglycan DD-metalloendopeptidase family protein [Stellaceae bacterium]